MNSHIYHSTVFDMACTQFDRAADILQMDTKLRLRVKLPKRCMAVSCPVQLDSGEVVIYEGFDLGEVPPRAGVLDGHRLVEEPLWLCHTLFPFIPSPRFR